MTISNQHQQESLSSFRLPPYPYDLLDKIKNLAKQKFGSVIDLSIGTPGDPPPASVVQALNDPSTLRGYPASKGSESFRFAASKWMSNSFNVEIAPSDIGACIGTKEFVASVPQWLRLANPSKDTILFPSLSYPTYAMGATLGGCRAVPIGIDSNWRLDLGSISKQDIERSLAIWVNSPGNPAGQVEDLESIVKWAQANDIPVFSDECYSEFSWTTHPKTALSYGTKGVVSVHSVSKRSNLAGVRAGFYAGDPELVNYLVEVRKHGGLMVPGPVQNWARIALLDQQHVNHQRDLYIERLKMFSALLDSYGTSGPLPEGGIYLWKKIPSRFASSWDFVEQFALDTGALVSPGDLYGQDGQGYVRVAMVQSMQLLDLVAQRIGS